MSGQWEQYVEPASHAYWEAGLTTSAPSERMRAAIAAVGPLIAEDTRVRMVAAAGRAVERDTAPPFYYCPTSGEIEQTYEGGFTICCEAPLCHEPISPAAVAAAKRVPS